MPTLRNHLHWYNISVDEACILFDRKERTLWNWNKNPPPWVLNVLKLHISANPVPKSWQGWRFFEDYLMSPEDQKYSQNDIRATQYGKQLAESITGSQSEIISLKTILERKIALNDSPLVVELKRDNKVISTIDINDYA